MVVDQDLRVVSGHTVRIEDNQVSRSTSTGAFSTAGGIGVQRNAYIGGVVTVTDETPSFKTATGSVVTSGGLGVAKDTHLGGDLDVGGDAIVSKDLSVMYGLAVTREATIGNKLEVQDTTKAGLTDGTAATVVIKGGMKVDKDSIFEKDVQIDGELNIAGTFGRSLIVNDTTNAINYETGSLVTEGGLSVELDAFVGGKLTVNQDTDADPSNVTVGAIVTDGGLATAKKLVVGTQATVKDTLSVESEQEATFYSLASVTLRGGLGVEKNIITGGEVEIQSTDNSQDSSTGALVVSGGLGMGADGNFKGKVTIEDTTQSFSDSTAATSTTSASATFAGGVGVSDNIIAGGGLEVQSTTQSTSSSTGALKVSGGLGVGASGNFGGKHVIEDDTQATGLTSASLATSGGIYAAKDVIVNGDLTISVVTSPSGTAIDISSSSALTVSSTSGSNIDIESGGNMTLKADKVTVETETPSSTSTPHLSLLDGYMDIMKKQVSVTSSFVTVATVELSYLKSCHVKVVVEGNWANNPALGTFEFLVMHNGGSDPEPGATNTSDSSQTLTGLVVEEQFVVDTSGSNYYTGVVTAENTGTSAKEFYVKFKAEGSSVSGSSSFTTNAVVTVSGAHSSVE